ncbi:transposase [Streptomyces hygroscopicus subsp. limoneus]|nr:transposase [Streptomyces hygroscopicus subsp. limoneus]
MPIGRFGPYPERLWQQFEGVIWRFKTGGQWREMPTEFGAWQTVHNRFRRWRDVRVFEALLEGLIAEAAKRGEVDLSLVSADSTTARAHHDAAGMQLGEDVLNALEEAAAEEEKARSKGAMSHGQDGRSADSDTAREERRRRRRRHRLRLKAALLGRSRGGQTSKIHVAADRKCRPLALVLTVGQAADSPQFIPVLKKVRVRQPVGRPAPGPTRSPGTRRTRPAATAPTCEDARSRRSSRRKRTRPPAGRRRAAEAVGPSARTPTSTRRGTLSSD